MQDRQQCVGLRYDTSYQRARRCHEQFIVVVSIRRQCKTRAVTVQCVHKKAQELLTAS